MKWPSLVKKSLTFTIFCGRGGQGSGLWRKEGEKEEEMQAWDDKTEKTLVPMRAEDRREWGDTQRKMIEEALAFGEYCNLKARHKPQEGPADEIWQKVESRRQKEKDGKNCRQTIKCWWWIIKKACLDVFFCPFWCTFLCSLEGDGFFVYIPILLVFLMLPHTLFFASLSYSSCPTLTSNKMVAKLTSLSAQMTTKDCETFLPITISNINTTCIMFSNILQLLLLNHHWNIFLQLLLFHFCQLSR